MSVPSTENKFCRRCGTELKHQIENLYTCSKGHKIYITSPPAVAVILFNENDDIAVITRGINPGLGMLDFPGGFCNYGEAPIDAMYRELKEEVGLDKSDLSNVKFLHTGIDSYEFDGEEILVTGIIYEAKCRNVELMAMDDAASSEFVPISKLSMKDIFFPSLQEAFGIIIERENHA